MGGDGGSIPKREDIVKKKEKTEQKDKQAENVAHYRYCQLSHQPLRPPIVACQLGRLYNKDAVIQYLLTPKADRSKASAEFMQHIKTLRDVTVLPHANAASNNVTSQGDIIETSGDWPFACPITSADSNGTQPFCFLRKCGCVFSRRGLNNIIPVDSTQKTSECPQCGENIVNIVDLYPSTDEQAKLLANLMATKEKHPTASSSKRKLDNIGVDEEEKAAPSRSVSTEKIASIDATGGHVSKKVVVNRNSKVVYPQSVEPESSTRKLFEESSVYKSLFTSSYKIAE